MCTNPNSLLALFSFRLGKCCCFYSSCQAWQASKTICMYVRQSVLSLRNTNCIVEMMVSASLGLLARGRWHRIPVDQLHIKHAQDRVFEQQLEFNWMTSITAETWSSCNLKINLIFITLPIALEKLPSHPGIPLVITRPHTPIKPLVLRVTIFRS